MRDVVAVATRVVIMRSGRKIHDRPIDGLSADDIGHMIMNSTVEAA
jgi:ABC-type sugar transport system ATPase subunit